MLRSLLKFIVPTVTSRYLATIFKPGPVPCTLVISLERKNRLNICSFLSSRMPMPALATSMVNSSLPMSLICFSASRVSLSFSLEFF